MDEIPDIEITLPFWNVLDVVALILIVLYIFIHKITCRAFLFLSYRIGDTGLKQFLDGPASTKIRELNLSNCIHLGDASMAKLSERYDKTIILHILLVAVYLLIWEIRDGLLKPFGKYQGCLEAGPIFG